MELHVIRYLLQIKAVNLGVLTMKIRLLILLFLLNVFLTSPRRTRKKSMKSSVRKDLKEIKEDISQLAADHKRMLARLKSLKNDKAESTLKKTLSNLGGRRQKENEEKWKKRFNEQSEDQKGQDSKRQES